MTPETLVRDGRFKWTAEVAAKPNQARPILECVKVEPGGVVASDGHRLRFHKFDTGADTLMPASSKRQVWESLRPQDFPAYERLSPTDVLGVITFNKPQIARIVATLEDRMTPEQKRRRRENRPYTIVQIARDALDGTIKVVAKLRDGNDDIGAPIIEPFAGTYDGTSIVALEIAFNGAYLVAALALADRMDFAGKTRPGRFHDGTGERYELLMPMFVNW